MKELQAFAKSNPEGTICKPIYHGLFVDGPDSYSVYTRQVSAKDFDGNEVWIARFSCRKKYLGSAILGSHLSGKRCFTAAVRTPSTTVDWRDPAANATFLPAEITPASKRNAGRCCLLSDCNTVRSISSAGQMAKMFFSRSTPLGSGRGSKTLSDSPCAGRSSDLFYGGPDAITDSLLNLRKLLAGAPRRDISSIL